jgi:hypothetical protein
MEAGLNKCTLQLERVEMPGYGRSPSPPSSMILRSNSAPSCCSFRRRRRRRGFYFDCDRSPGLADYLTGSLLSRRGDYTKR